MTFKPGCRTYYAITEDRISSVSKNLEKKNKWNAVFYLPSIHQDKESPKDDIDSLLKHINLVNIKEWGTKYIYWVQMAQPLKTAMKFSF